MDPVIVIKWLKWCLPCVCDQLSWRGRAWGFLVRVCFFFFPGKEGVLGKSWFGRLEDWDRLAAAAAFRTGSSHRRRSDAFNGRTWRHITLPDLGEQHLPLIPIRAPPVLFLLHTAIYHHTAVLYSCFCLFRINIWLYSWKTYTPTIPQILIAADLASSLSSQLAHCSQ